MTGKAPGLYQIDQLGSVTPTQLASRSNDPDLMTLNNTSQTAMDRFLDTLDLPPHLKSKYPTPKTQAKAVLSEYFNWSKGQAGLSEFLTQCFEVEVPQWIRDTCRDLQKLCEPPPQSESIEPASSDAAFSETVVPPDAPAESEVAGAYVPNKKS